jgi:hypothetical protein
MIRHEPVMASIDLAVTGMPMIDASAHRRQALVAVRWGLIAVCASLILFSDKMSGRLGFAALLLLAVVVGRYASRRMTRVLEAENRPVPDVPRQHAPAPQDDLPRREAGH